MTQKAWNLNYREALPTAPDLTCGTCSHRMGVPSDWCNEVGMPVERGKVCLNHQMRKETKWSR